MDGCNSLGSSRGMVILWGKGSFSLNFSFIGQGFVGININWKGIGYNLVSNYAPSSLIARRVLCKSLVERKRKSRNEELCLGEDFIEVVSREERLEEVYYHIRIGMEEFRIFIENMGLVDILCVGGKLTWLKGNENAMSILDRFLVSRKLIEEYGVID